MRGMSSAFVAAVAIALVGCAGTGDGETHGEGAPGGEPVAAAEYAAYTMPTPMDIRALPKGFSFVPKGCQNFVEVRSSRQTLTAAGTSGWIVYGVCTRSTAVTGAAVPPYIAWAIYGTTPAEYGALAGGVAQEIAASALLDLPIGHGGNGLIIKPCCKGPTGLPGPDRIMLQALNTDMQASAGWAAF